jgi:ABC-2 type transport system permease protein/sodium transport system permease protein
MSITSSSPPPPIPVFGSGRVLRLIRKELSEILRDRRTLLTLLLMPILLYPLMGMVFVFFFQTQLHSIIRPSYRLGFASATEADQLGGYFLLGERALLRQGVFRDTSDPPRMKADEVPPHLENLPVLEYEILESPEEGVLSGKVDVGLRLRKGTFRPFGDKGKLQMQNLAAEWELFYSGDSVNGRDAVRHLQRLCAAANTQFLGDRLNHNLIVQTMPPVSTVPVKLSVPEGKRNPLLGALVPLVLILMTITGAVYPAIDLTAGERERGTLEILMAAPIPRLSVLLAKYVAVVTVAMFTALVNLGSMTVTLLALQVAKEIFADTATMLLVLVQMFGLLLLFASFFSAIVLALTSVARSFKEAQAYLIPLILAALMPGLVSLLPGLRLEGAFLYIPLMNIVLLARDLLEGNANLQAALVVIGMTIVYALLAIALAARIFGAEAIAGSNKGRWKDILRHLFHRGE